MSNIKVNIGLEISHPECELLFKVFTSELLWIDKSNFKAIVGLEISHPEYELLFFRNTTVILIPCG